MSPKIVKKRENLKNSQSRLSPLIYSSSYILFLLYTILQKSLVYFLNPVRIKRQIFKRNHDVCIVNLRNQEISISVHDV